MKTFDFIHCPSLLQLVLPRMRTPCWTCPRTRASCRLSRRPLVSSCRNRRRDLPNYRFHTDNFSLMTHDGGAAAWWWETSHGPFRNSLSFVFFSSLSSSAHVTAKVGFNSFLMVSVPLQNSTVSYYYVYVMWLSFTCYLVLYEECSSIVQEEVESMAIWHVVVRVTVGRKIITFPRFPSRRGKLLKLFVSSPVLPSSPS